MGGLSDFVCFMVHTGEVVEEGAAELMARDVAGTSNQEE